MLDIRGTQTWSAAATVVASIHDNGLVVFHTGKGRLFAGNRTGAHIWRCLEQNLSVDAMAATIGRDYRIPVILAGEHIARFLTELQRHGLITPRAGA